MRIAALLACLALPIAAHAADDLAAGFRQPPPDARPQTWWHWMNGNITKEGITADLEAMQRIGVGGAQIFNVAQGEPAGPVKVLSPEWFALVKHAITEADRLGLVITMHNCPGWSESGGPWITADQAMQRVVWSELRVHGPQKLEADLPTPAMVVANTCHDIAVLAFPAAPAEAQPASAVVATVTASAPVKGDLRALLTASAGPAVELPLPVPGKPQTITIGFPQPQRCGSVRLIGREYVNMPVAGTVEASDDGTTFRQVGELPVLTNGRTHPSVLVPFPETTARFYRIVITKVDARAKALVLTAIDLGAARLTQTEARAGFRASAKYSFLPEEIPAADTIRRDAVTDVTAHVTNGHVSWEVPAGDWTIVRFAYSPTGQMNSPAPQDVRGYESDKMNRAAVDTNFNAMMGRVIADVGPLADKTFKAVLADSWEAGCENWTPAFRAEFLRRRGYDPLPFLPVITGRAVGDSDTSQRFLWDYRRTIGDLIAENHYAEFRRLCAQHGMLFTAEAPGIGMPTVADELECKGRTDVPMGEFWMDGHNDSKETASAAHVYGAKIAAAEAFTARTPDAKWMKTPFDHKRLGDLHFTLGINRYVFHRYAHQPWLDRVPGMTMGPWGTNFERTNTWWEQAKAWMEYITRCQYLLQSGIPVSDIAYFYGENVPNTLAGNQPDLPGGYDYDAVNAEVLLTRMSVRDGRLVLPDGTSYALLLLPESDRMTPAVLAKIKDLVEAGATVVGARPTRSPSLANYPRCDEQVRSLAAELWGDADGVRVTEHRLGKGRVIPAPLASALASAHLAPDFSAAGEGKFAAIHRRIGDADVYFVSSQNDGAASAALTFRVSGRAPELWYPDSGRIVRAARFTSAAGATTVPVEFEPAGSVFVVFRSPAAGVDPVVSLTRDGVPASAGVELGLNGGNAVTLTTSMPGRYVLRTQSGAQRTAVIEPLPAALEITGPWTLRFPAGWGAPAETQLPQLASWTENTDDGIKYFSGTATYVRDVEIPADRLGAGRTLWLDLGTVKEVAEVTVNGRNLGILWKPPFRADITGVAHAGHNTVEVRVTNLWPNRMIGDQKLPENQRHTWATFNPFKVDSPLLPSGLLGPVQLTEAATVTAQ